MTWFAWELGEGGVDCYGLPYPAGDMLKSLGGLVIVSENREELESFDLHHRIVEMDEPPANHITVRRWVHGLSRGADLDALLPIGWEWLPQTPEMELDGAGCMGIACPCGEHVLAETGYPQVPCAKCGRTFQIVATVAYSPPNRGAADLERCDRRPRRSIFNLHERAINAGPEPIATNVEKHLEGAEEKEGHHART